MSHRTLVNGTAYEITGGKTLVDGTAYSISKGKTLVDGTAYEIKMGGGVCIFDFGTITPTKNSILGFSSYTIVTTVSANPADIDTMVVNGVEYPMAYVNPVNVDDYYGFVIEDSGINNALLSPTQDYPYTASFSPVNSDGTRNINFKSKNEGTFTVSLWSKK